MNTHSQPHALVVGGSDGLGLAIARLLANYGYRVFATGTGARPYPDGENIAFIDLKVGMNLERAAADLGRVLEVSMPLETLVYSAGFHERGPLGEESDETIASLANLGFTVPALLVGKILRMQPELLNLILITSTSQWIPRLKEPVYTGTKSGLAKFGESVSLDPRVGKVLVVGPAGMDTKMLGEKRPGNLLDPTWVAAETLGLLKQEFFYKLVRVLRDPPRVEPVEERKTREYPMNK